VSQADAQRESRSNSPHPPLLCVPCWPFRSAARATPKVSRPSFHGDLLIDFRGRFDIHFPLVGAAANRFVPTSTLYVCEPAYDSIPR
jgi:hypothetical protein